MIVERGSMRGAARAMGVDKDTVCSWVRKASEHAEAFTEYMLHDLHMTAVELDELWAAVKKREHIEDEEDADRIGGGDGLEGGGAPFQARGRLGGGEENRTGSERTDLASSGVAAHPDPGRVDHGKEHLFSAFVPARASVT